MIEALLEELIEAVKANTAALGATPAAPAKPAKKPAKAKTPDPEPEEAPEPEAPAEPAVEISRPEWIGKITEVFKERLNATEPETPERQAVKDAFAAIREREEFAIATINDLPDDKLEAFHDVVEAEL